MSNKKQQVEQTNKQELDPRMAGYLFGTDEKGNASPDAIQPNMPGLFSMAMDLYNKGPSEYYGGSIYAGLNDTQKGAINGMSNYYKSNDSMAGANAASNYGNSLLAKPDTFGGVNTFSSLPQLDAGNKVNAPTVANIAPIGSASVGTSGVDWKTPLNQTLQGKIDNPYLSQIADTIGRQASDNYNRNIAPSIRGGAQMAGQFGGSRQGVIEANALKDLNQGVADNVSSLYGNAYNQAQQAKNSSAMQLAGQESGERISQAQLAQQAALTQAQISQQKALQDAQLQYQSQRDNQQAGLQYGNLALQDKINSGNLNLNADNQTFNQKLSGISLLNQSAQQPIQNYQGLLGLGGLQQQDQQNHIDADKARWDYNQNKDWNNLGRISGLLTGNASLGASNTGTSQQFYNPTLQLLGAAGGLMSAAGGAYATGGLLTSDRRVKKDIQQIGYTPGGFPLYTFRYHWDHPDESPRIGVMAQDIEKIIPDAVITRPDGIKAVNYTMVN